VRWYGDRTFDRETEEDCNLVETKLQEGDDGIVVVLYLLLTFPLLPASIVRQDPLYQAMHRIPPNSKLALCQPFFMRMTVAQLRVK